MWVCTGLVWAGAASAQAFEGVVFLPDGTPAVDATVSVLTATGSTRTGPDGAFTWTPDPHPPFQILIILRGGNYTSPVLVEALPEAGRPLRVQVETLISESVTVRAGGAVYTEAPPASAATILAREDLQLRRPQNLVSAVEAVPGASRGGEGHASVPSLRGLARGRTLVLIDGARVTTERRAGPSATYLDPFLLEAVEVSRGFGSVTYGSDAFGGVIHARTREVAPDADLGFRFQGSLGTGVPEKAAVAEVSKGLGEGGVLVQARYREFQDYDSALGTVRNSQAKDHGFRLRFDHELGPGRMHLGWQSDFGRDIGRPTEDPDPISLTLYPEENSRRLTFGYEADPRGSTSLSAQGFVGGYGLITRRETLATESQGRGTQDSDVTAGDYGLRLSGSSAVRSWRVQAGLDLNGRTGLRALDVETEFDLAGRETSIVTQQTIEEAMRRDWAGFVTIDGRILRRLTGALGARLDYVTTNNEGGFFGQRETSASAVSGFGSLTFAMGAGWTLTGQVGSGFRDPTLSDRYFRGVTGRGVITGNPELGPERSLQYDFALRHAGRVRSALYAYRYEIRDLIERYRGDAGGFLFRNRGRARIRGIEFEAQADVGWGLSVELSAQAAAGEAQDEEPPLDGAALDDVPSEGLSVALHKRFGKAGAATLRTIVRARDDAPGPNEIVNPAYGVVHASMMWRWQPHVEMRLALGNILDADYRRSPDDLATRAPGRSAVFTLAASF